MSWDSYRRYVGTDAWDVIVIGSGIGGLTAALLLAKHARLRVLVLERHYEAGGFTHTFRRKDYEWDVGVHYIGDVGDARRPLRRLFDELTGGRLQWAPLPDVYDRVFVEDRAYDLISGYERFREQLAGHFPDQTAAIDGYLARLRQVSATAYRFFAEKIVPPPVAALAGGWLRRPFLRLAGRTTADVLAELTRDPELTAVLTAQYGDYGLPPRQSSFAIHAMVANHYMRGGFYPVGGAVSIARGVTTEIESHGGRLLVAAEVVEIELDGSRVGGVRMADGRRFRAPVVISDTGVTSTLGTLLGAGAPRVPALEAARRIGPSAAHLGVYLGLRGDDAELGLDGTNLWIFPGPDHDANFERFHADPAAPLPLVYVSFPSAKDPTFAERHPGRSTIDVITLASYDWFHDWESAGWMKRGEAYERLKRDLADRALAVLFAHRPQVRDRIEALEVSTPLTTRHFTAWQRGEIYGLAHTPARFAERSLKPRLPIRGLYLAGQDVATCGVAGAMMGGAMAASAVAGRPLFPR